MLLDYVATYPNDRITIRAINMILVDHSYAGCLNESKACRRAGSHIFLYEDKPVPKLIGTVLTITKIIKFGVSSLAKAKLAGLFIVGLTILL